jgi:hypothetical protein
MGLTTQPFEFRYFAHQIEDWRNQQNTDNSKIRYQFTCAEIKLFETQFQSTLRTLQNAPSAVADKIKKFEICLRHSQSISSSMAGGIEFSKLLSNNNPLQFLIIFPFDKISIRPYNKEQFMEVACEICFLAFDTVIALESYNPDPNNLESIFLQSDFLDTKAHCIGELSRYFEINYGVSQLPKAYRGFL